jgi:hypothetical protein
MQSVRDSSPVALCTIFRTAPFALKLDWFASENAPPAIFTANPVPKCVKSLNRIWNICPDATLMIGDAPPLMDKLQASITSWFTVTEVEPVLDSDMSGAVAV